MKLIVGLGNPGREYNKTRHNIGFMCVDKIAQYFKVDFTLNKFKGLYTQFNYNGEKINPNDWNSLILDSSHRKKYGLDEDD